MRLPVTVGVTGGIGSGKSTVCRVFSCLGIPVYHADDRAKWLTEHHPEVKSEVIGLLGEEAYTPAGTYNREFVSSRVFDDKDLLSRLNRIIHPRVQEDTRAWVEGYRGVPYVLKEAAIMSKAGGENGLDRVIAVVSPEALRIRRVLVRDLQRTEAQVRSIIASQASEDFLYSIADFIVRNDEAEAMIPQVLKIHALLSEYSSSRT